MTGCASAKSQRRQTSGQLLILVVVSTLLVSVLPTVAGDKRTVVPDSALVIEYDVREDRVLVTLRGLEADRVTRDDAVRIVSLPGNQRAILSQVRLFRQQIARRHHRSAQIGRALFDALIAPIWGDLAGKRIIVVRPDDILRELPFQALVSPSGKYLIESLAVLYLPHLDRRLSRGKADGAGQVSGRARLLTVGNPAPGGRLAGDRPVTQRSVAVPPLPEAELEARVIAGIHGVEESDLLTGRYATEAAFRELAPDRRYIHLATHAVTDPADPLRSHYVLARSGADQDEDGRLEVREIRELQFRAEVAVLSACETARVSRDADNQITGLGLAFLEAGCQSAIVSLWETDSRRTANLVVRFFETMLKCDGTGPVRMAAALRLTALELIKNRATRHPYYWAGMSVIGQ